MPAFAPQVPTGSIVAFSLGVGFTAPVGWLFCGGAAFSRTTYSNLFATIVPSLGTVTISIASPGVVSYSGAALLLGEAVFFTTTGSLPTGLSPNTLYYLSAASGTNYNVATSRANAYAGTWITTTGSQSGTHTMWYCPYGLGDGSTTFNVPDLRGRVPAGADNNTGTLNLAESQGSYGNNGASGGEQGHTLTSGESGLPSHFHPEQVAAATGGGATGITGTSNLTGNTGSTQNTASVSAANASNAHNNVQPTTVLGSYIIKT